MRKSSFYLLIFITVILNLAFVIAQFFSLSHPSSWLAWILISNGFLINIIILCVTYFEISKILEYLKLPSFYKPKVKPSSSVCPTIEAQIKRSINETFSEAFNIEASDELLKSIQRKLNRVENTLGITYKKNGSPNMNKELTIQKLLLDIEKKLDIYLQQTQAINENDESNQEKTKPVEKPYQTLEINQSDIDGSETVQSDKNPVAISSELKEIIKRFNDDNKNHFLTIGCEFLVLNDKSINHQPSLSGNTIVELVPSDDSHETYFKIQVNDDNWLFPNLNSRDYNRIMKNLNSLIFEINSNSDSLQLLKPAKLKRISSGLWEIAEMGVFIDKSN